MHTAVVVLSLSALWCGANSTFFFFLQNMKLVHVLGIHRSDRTDASLLSPFNDEGAFFHPDKIVPRASCRVAQFVPPSHEAPPSTF